MWGAARGTPRDASPYPAGVGLAALRLFRARSRLGPWRMVGPFAAGVPPWPDLIRALETTLHVPTGCVHLRRLWWIHAPPRRRASREIRCYRRPPLAGDALFGRLPSRSPT